MAEILIKHWCLYNKQQFCIVVNTNVTVDAICCWVHTRDIIPIKLQFVVFHDHMHALSGLGICPKFKQFF